MRGRGEAVMMTLFGVSKTYGKAYCYPSQKKLLELLGRYHDFGISRRTLNRDLRFLEDDGYIKRVRRHLRLRDGGILFSSTLYKFTRKAFKYLAGLGKWCSGLLSAFRVPKLAQHKSLRETRIFLEGGAPCGNVVEIASREGPARVKCNPVGSERKKTHL